MLYRKFKKFTESIIMWFYPAQVVSFEYSEKTEVLRVLWSDGDTCEYYGSGTVWYYGPEFKRCNSGTEAALSRCYSKHMFDLKHKKS